MAAVASAVIVFAAWRRPWRYLSRLAPGEDRIVALLGIVLAGMNSLFYLAIKELPLGAVGAIEGPIGVAAVGARSARNYIAPAIAVGGVAILTDVRMSGSPLCYLFAFANCALFVLYIILGVRICGEGGLDRLALSAVGVGIHRR